jgi:hypothetical protein
MNRLQPQPPPFLPGDRVRLLPRSTLWAAGVRVATVLDVVPVGRHIRRMAARAGMSLKDACLAVFAAPRVPPDLRAVRWPLLLIEPVPRWPAGGQVLVRPSTIEKADIPPTRN